jgi:dTDP-4-dehydrorhamnose reductase
MIQTTVLPPLELWGGHECTVNRVGERYFDQTERSGHGRRPADLDRFAALGIRTLRYPLLWERVVPAGAPDWSWADERLGRLRALGVRPIAGLVHHGSGPRHTSLLDPAFPAGLAAYARAVAERYPWIDAYTPVNEPLTTARFSALYGHWYPHARDDRSFVAALLNQCRAVALAMAAVRAVNPAAQLVQTDDLGSCQSVPALAYQAAFENERRWLAFDLLCGRVTPAHPLWGYLRWAGASEADLAWFQDHPCPPDVVGVNYYLTSERYLDGALAAYPPHTHGGNGREAYADVEAVRVRGVAPVGLRALLLAAWERYRIPLAVTEAHNGCTREEQLRWLAETWAAAAGARAAGADVRAVTLWALLGSYDWDSLVTRETGRYEPGAFDVSGPAPRPTALAGMAAELGAGQAPSHPVLDTAGWWRRPARLLYGDPAAPEAPSPWAAPLARAPRPLLIAGGGGLARAFARLCELRGLHCLLLGRGRLDPADPAVVAAALDAARPWAVVHAGGYGRVDAAEREPERCFRENVAGPGLLAAACAARGLPLLTFSSDLVFCGGERSPYLESSAPRPLSVYGRSKLEAEAAVLGAHPGALVARTSALFGPWDAQNFLAVVRRRLARGEPVAADAESIIAPTYVPDLVHAALDLLVDGAAGLWHLANAGAASWADLARWAAAADGHGEAAVQPRPAGAMGYLAPRPRYSVLGSERSALLPPLQDALERFRRECEMAA